MLAIYIHACIYVLCISGVLKCLTVERREKGDRREEVNKQETSN